MATTHPATITTINTVSYERRNLPRLNCLQAPLVLLPGMSYTRHKADMFIFFELIFHVLLAPFDNCSPKKIAEELFMWLGFFSFLNKELVAKHLEMLRIMKNDAFHPVYFYTCVQYDIPTSFGKAFFAKMYPLTKVGWQNKIAKECKLPWMRFRNCQGGRHAPQQHQTYRQLVDEEGKSLAEHTALDNTVPVMTIRTANTANLAKVLQSDVSLESPFAYQGRTIFTRSWNFYNDAGQEIDPENGKIIEVPKFDFENPIWLSDDDQTLT